jgi:hypothetical protein
MQGVTKFAPVEGCLRSIGVSNTTQQRGFAEGTLVGFFLGVNLVTQSVRSALTRMQKHGSSCRMTAVRDFSVSFERDLARCGAILQFFLSLPSGKQRTLRQEDIERYNRSAQTVLKAHRGIAEKEWLINLARQGLVDSTWLVCRKCGKLVLKAKALGDYCDARCRKGAYNTRDWVKRKTKHHV